MQGTVRDGGGMRCRGFRIEGASQGSEMEWKRWANAISNCSQPSRFLSLHLASAYPPSPARLWLLQVVQPVPGSPIGIEDMADFAVPVVKAQSRDERFAVREVSQRCEVLKVGQRGAGREVPLSMPLHASLCLSMPHYAPFAGSCQQPA